LDDADDCGDECHTEKNETSRSHFHNCHSSVFWVIDEGEEKDQTNDGENQNEDAGKKTFIGLGTVD
jgi:hypothetical protein